MLKNDTDVYKSLSGLVERNNSTNADRGSGRNLERERSPPWRTVDECMPVPDLKGVLVPFFVLASVEYIRTMIPNIMVKFR